MMKRKKSGEIRERGGIRVKREQERWWVVLESISVSLKCLHALKQREITFCAHQPTMFDRNKL